VAKTLAPANWQRAVVVLAGTVVATAVITCLYWAQAVFIPVALAVFLTFVLSPAVTALQRRRLGLFLAPLTVMVARGLFDGRGVGQRPAARFCARPPRS